MASGRATERTIFSAAGGEEAVGVRGAGTRVLRSEVGRSYIEELEADLAVRSPSSVKWAWISDRKKKAHTKYLRPSSKGSPNLILIGSPLSFDGGRAPARPPSLLLPERANAC
jgi:hypothetical protein